MKRMFFGISGLIVAVGAFAVLTSAACSSSNGSELQDGVEPKEDAGADAEPGSKNDGGSKNDATANSEAEAPPPVSSGEAGACTSENLLGSWKVESGSAKVIVYTFNGDGTFSIIINDAEDAGLTDEEKMTGTYATSNEELTLTITESTCSTTESPVITACGVLQENLYLTGIILNPLASLLDAGTVILGCGSPIFTPQPLMPLHGNDQ